MRFDRDRHRRHSTRLKGYNYASPGAYFVTICVAGREPVLGDVIDAEMRLSQWGQVVDDFWTQLPTHFPNISIDTHVTMPNHVHAIIVIHDTVPRRGAVSAPNADAPSTPTLGRIIAYYKYQTTQAINLMRDAPGGRFWQRNYHDRIIRDQRQLAALRQYIAQNPAQWALDAENPERPDVWVSPVPKPPNPRGAIDRNR